MSFMDLPLILISALVGNQAFSRLLEERSRPSRRRLSPLPFDRYVLVPIKQMLINLIGAGVTLVIAAELSD